MKTLLCIGQGVGNVVMATPMVRAFRRRGHDIDIFSYADRGGADLLRGWHAVDRVFTSESDPRLVAERYDILVRGVWGRFPSAARGRRTIEPEPLDLRVHHETQANMSAARQAGYRGPTPPAHAERDAPGCSLPKRFVALAPGIGSRGPDWDRKLWPHWSGLARRLRQSGRQVVVVGSRDDRRIDLGAGDFFDLRGRTTLRQAAGVLALAERFVAVDNGLAHVAGALGVQTTVLFGFTSERKNRPAGPVRLLAADVACRPCQMTPRERTCRDARCIEAIAIEDVLATASPTN